ncbi:ATP-binding protein [uncultured Halopseudomonas sp.]|uniref:sensor histidine kinase n=1 Tax=uncultured Halopseudomonas sp. TaxID=2901193 RepID=UPI0030EE1743|tara:strand:- start:25185 stop:26330 length:1146 start_codon:yes stop_codon:yes gene_type:complete
MTTTSTPQSSLPLKSQAVGDLPDNRTALLLAVQAQERLIECLSNSQLSFEETVVCDAAAIIVNQEVISLQGDCELRALKALSSLHEAAITGVYYSGLQEQVDGDLEGVLAICFCPPEDGWLLWFRDGQTSQKDGWSDADIAATTSLRGDLLEACLQRAAMTSRVQQSLIARLGHDLSNPLQSLTMSAALLRPQSERDIEMTKHIIAAGKKMDRMLAQIRDLNQLQMGNKISINPVETNLSALVKSVLEDEQTLYPDLTIEAQIEPVINAMVDAERYTEVIAHLLNNASQQSKAETPTIVKLTREDDTSTLTVSSQIDPLSAEQMAGLFQPVTSDSPASEQSGLGMGLYICAAIVQAHEGSVYADQGDGSIDFCLTLPLLKQ